MARTKALSPTAKRRALQRQESRLRRELDKVLDKIEACAICNQEKLEKEARRLEAKHEKERNALAKKLGIDPSELGESKKKTSKKKTSKKKAAKKKATKKKTAKKKAARKKTAKKKTAKRKTSKKKAAKKSGKKSSAVSG